MNKSHSNSFEDKYKELETDLNKESDFAVHYSELKESMKLELLAVKNEIRSGKKISKVKRRDYFYKIRRFFWKFIMNLYYRL